MDELFEIEESKSPKMLWMERHGVSVFGPDEDDEFCAEAWDDRGEGMWREAYGIGEQEAIAELAAKCGWKLWNEEDAST